MAGTDIPAQSPLQENVDLLSFKIFVDGTELPTKYNIQSINVHKAINKIATAEFTFLDGEPAEQDFKLQEEELVVPGKSIKIQAGYHQDVKDIYEGVVLKIGISIKSGGHSEITCYCVHKAFYLTLGRHNKYFKDKKDSEIIKQVIDDYGISCNVESTKFKHAQIIQYGALDWDFIMSRLEVNGLILLTEKNQIKVKKPGFNTGPVHKLTYGVDIVKSEMEIDASFQLKKVKCHAWSHSEQKLVESGNSNVSVNDQGSSGAIEFSKLANEFNKKDFQLFNTGNLERDELEVWATAQYLKSKMSRTVGTIHCHGTEKFNPDTIVELKGVSKLFDGKAYISSVNHFLQSGNWRVELEVGAQKDWYLESRNDVTETPTAALLPAMEGHYIGKVIALSGDPDGESRIKIDIPIVTESSEGVWARLLSQHASSTHGSYYVPEIDDEVLVAFLHGDSRYPIVLGSLYSSKLSSPYKHDNQNNTKGFVSRSKLKLTYDEMKKSIVLETPGGRKTTMDDMGQSVKIEDPFNNFIKMGAGGIEISSTNQIKINGIAGITINGTAKVDVTTVGNLNMQGTKASLTGMANVGVTAPTIAISGGLVKLGSMIVIA